MSATNLILLFGVDDKRLALRGKDVKLITRAVEITPLNDSPEEVLGVISFHGTLIPVLNLRKRLHLPERDVLASDFLLLVNTNYRTIGLVVTRVDDVISLDGKTSVSHEALFSGDAPVQLLHIDNKLIELQDLAEVLADFELKQAAS